MTPLRRRRGRVAGGQTLVEFALVIPVFLLIVFGVIDGGRMVFAQVTLNEAAREAARVALVQAPFIGLTDTQCTAPTCPGTTADLRSNVRAAANRQSLVIGPIATSGLYIDCTAAGFARSGGWTGGNDCGANRAAGANNVVNVRLTARFRPVTPIAGQLLDSLFPDAEVLSASSSMSIP